MNFIGSKLIETDRLILRPTIKDDLYKLWSLLCIPEVNRFYLVGKFNTDWEKEEKWQLKKLERANNPDVFQWSIVLKDTLECIGQISVQEGSDDLSIRDIGWFISPDHQRKGYTYEAAQSILDYMFNEVNIQSIETSSAIKNPASFKLMEKLGFVKSGIPNTVAHYTFGEVCELCHYHIDKSLLKSNSIKTK